MLVALASNNDRTVNQALTSETKAALDYDSFLKLLVATMQNQDPTEPNDPAQTLSQLASFSVVEQGIKTNTKLERLLATSAAGQAASLVGRTLTSADGTATGLVKGVELSGSGFIATLEDGTQITLGEGVRIS